MRESFLSLGLLGVVALCLATALDPWFQSWAGNRAASKDILQLALGDGRRLFARQVYAKADAYFHNGYYPTIYDNPEGFQRAHIAEERHQNGSDDAEEEENFLGKPKDWLDAFGRHFYPARHTHLGDSGCGHSCCQRAKSGQGHDEDCPHKNHDASTHAAQGGEEREILPWLRLSSDLDPQHVETYVVGAFWLRSKLGKIDEAERFLREGLQANPGDFEILYELGRIYSENRKDKDRARNVWELALQNWRQREPAKAQPNLLAYAQILNSLATLEWYENHFDRSIQHLEALKAVSGNKQTIQKWIDEARSKLAAPSSSPSGPVR
jgi:tetratricopeptide (TPR) repeat protein